MRRRNGLLHVLLTLFLAGVTVLGAGCGEDDETPSTTVQQTGTITELAAANGELSTLVSALETAGLAETLGGEGPFTVFAPTNAAFDKLDDAALQALLADKEALSQVLLTHVVNGKLSAPDVAASTTLTTLSGATLTVEVDGAAVRVNGARITTVDIEASNGVIHLIDTVILEQEQVEPEPGTIVEVATEAGGFGTLLAAVDAAGLTDDLSGAGPLTVFAPNDAAFAKLPAGTVEALLADIPALTDILLSHVAQGRLNAAAVTSSGALTMLSGVELEVNSSGGATFIGGAEITATDIPASNGIIHVLGDVIVPADEQPGTIVEVATEAGDFSTLLAAVEAADLTDELGTLSPLTVFAPTDSAFAGLPPGTVEALLADIPALTAILLSHVVQDNLDAATIASRSSLTMLSGVELEITSEGGATFIGGAEIAATDIPASNGIIHVLADVIVPEVDEPGTIAEIAASSDDFSTLVTALGAADLVDTLDDADATFTVFAPTNAAFDGLPEGALEALLADIPALTDILLSHVAEGELRAADVLGRSTITMLSGVELEITSEGDDAFIGGARIADVDIEASNGVIHVLADVIIPEVDEPGTIAEIAAGGEDFSTLVAALEAADLVDTLSDPDAEFTVFAPTNGAFDNLPEGTLDALLADIPALTDILLAHVAEGALSSAMVLAMDEIDTLAGVKLDVVVEGEEVFIGGAALIDTDIPASNGVVHVLGDVIVPAPTIVDIAVGSDDFSTLVAALEAADLVDTLDDRDAEFTVFAPTNGAFDNLPEGTLDALLADIPALTDVLLSHVVAGTVLEADVAGLRRVETLSGAVLEVRIEEGGVFVGNAPVLDTDILAANGVVHVIGEVIVPGEDDLETIAEIAAGGEDFTTLVTALGAADLVDTLNDPDATFTVFAPTNGAFGNLPEGTLDALLADIPALTDVLLSHVVAGAVFEADVAGLRRVETLSGAVLEVRIEEGGVFVGNAPVLDTDILAANGVVHVIGEVIVPGEDDLETIAEIAAGGEDFTTLVTALGAADLVDTLNDPDATFTVFAPTNSAFDGLPEGTLDALLADIPALTDVLLSHVVEGELRAADVLGRATITTLSGAELEVTTEGGDAFIGGAIIAATDITASNGVVHVLGDVIVPE